MIENVWFIVNASKCGNLESNMDLLTCHLIVFMRSLEKRRTWMRCVRVI